jgi:hypothetical protein
MADHSLDHLEEDHLFLDRVLEFILYNKIII